MYFVMCHCENPQNLPLGSQAGCGDLESHIVLHVHILHYWKLLEHSCAIGFIFIDSPYYLPFTGWSIAVCFILQSYFQFTP